MMVVPSLVHHLHVLLGDDPGPGHGVAVPPPPHSLGDADIQGVQLGALGVPGRSIRVGNSELGTPEHSTATPSHLQANNTVTVAALPKVCQIDQAH